MNATLQLFGERVAVIAVEEEMQGSIFVPQERNKAYELGRVLAVGDCKRPDGKQQGPWVREGDIVLYQLIGAAHQEATKYVLDGHAIRILNQNDLLGRLSSTSVLLENFEILGNYVLLRAVPGQMSPTIKVPSQFVPRECWRFFVVQKGAGVDIPINLGQEVYAERDRTTPLEIQSRHKLLDQRGREIEESQIFGFCNYQCIHGSLFHAETEEAKALTE
jgi:co-chaperonin GroES (HSP10)